MQMMHAAGVGGVTMAAEAMISLSVALSPPLTLLPPRSVPVDINARSYLRSTRPLRRWGQLSPTRLNVDGRRPPSAVTAVTNARDACPLIGGLPMQPLWMALPAMQAVV